MTLQDPVHVLIEWSGGKVATPVMVFSVSVSKEVSTEGGIALGMLAGHSVGLLPKG